MSYRAGSYASCCEILERDELLCFKKSGHQTGHDCRIGCVYEARAVDDCRLGVARVLPIISRKGGVWRLGVMNLGLLV